MRAIVHSPDATLLPATDPPARGPSWIPEQLHAVGPAGLEVWQWISLVALVIVAYLLRRPVAAIPRLLLRAVASRTAARWDDEVVDRLGGALRLMAVVGLFRCGMPWLELDPDATITLYGILYASVGLGIAWAAFAAIDIAVAHLGAADWASRRPASRALLVLGGRIGKALVIGISLIAFLGALHVPIASLVAGLGIGGIALAFGAQKTVENLFGAFSLGVDQPLREGDFVRVDGSVLGTVEKIGLRSTQIRTLDRTVITLPNGRLADMQIETFAVRDRVRLVTTIGVVYSTTRAQLLAVLAGLEQTLRSHPGIWPDTIVVRFAGFGPSSLDIEIMAWFVTSDYNQFRDWRQEVLVGFIDVVERAGTGFAFPTQSIHIESVPAAAVPTAGVEPASPE